MPRLHEEDRQGPSRRQPRELLVHCLPKPPMLPTVGILITQKFFCASSALSSQRWTADRDPRAQIIALDHGRSKGGIKQPPRVPPIIQWNERLPA